MRSGTLAILLGIAFSISQGAEVRNAAAQTTPASASKTMSPYGRAEPPIGYLDFCDDHRLDCQPQGATLERVQLTPDRWRELVVLNREINEAIKPMSDSTQYGVVERWTFPESGFGDCEDYVLLKRVKLMRLGWPQSALLITVVRDENNEGHAILTVRTSQGDYVLDNKHSRVLPWQRTPYVFIKRQSAKDPRQWVSLVPVEPSLPVASAGVDWKD